MNHYGPSNALIQTVIDKNNVAKIKGNDSIPVLEVIYSLQSQVELNDSKDKIV